MSGMQRDCHGDGGRRSWAKSRIARTSLRRPEAVFTGRQPMPSAVLYISMIASSSAMSSGLRLRRAMTLRITPVS